jgi:hypothetical protein
VSADQALRAKTPAGQVSRRDRFLAWLVTGAPSRVVAFLWDFAAAWLRWATNKLRRR